jgi:formate hydrogenlyase subunit 4
MAHEGMVLEYSGRPLGLIHWATMVKQLALLALISACFFPWGMAAAGDRSAGALLVGLASFIAKSGALALLLGVIETSTAKLRIFRAPDLIGFASVLGMLAVLATSLGSG